MSIPVVDILVTWSLTVYIAYLGGQDRVRRDWVNAIDELTGMVVDKEKEIARMPS